jgi:hypothetical protein
MKSTENHIVAKARRWAIAEFTHLTHGKLPYETHLAAVAGLVSCYTRDGDVIAAAWLHDLVEDFREQFTVADVRTMTNDRVAHLVDLLTDPPGPRALVKQISLERIATDEDASLIKLCDRFHNQSTTIIDGKPKFLNMYVAEFDHFIGTIGGPFHEKLLVAPLLEALYKQNFQMREMIRQLNIAPPLTMSKCQA